MTIGKIIYDLRISEGLTQNNLAIAAGISERYVNFIEKDKKNPSNKVLIKIAKAVNRDLTTFFSVEHEAYTVFFSLPGTHRILDFDQNLLLNEKRLLQYCINLHRNNRDNANNLAQATQTEALLYHYRFRGQCPFYAWLYSIAYNLYLGSIKKDKNLSFIETYIETGLLEEDTVQLPDVNLIRYIDNLSTRDREIVKLRLAKLSYQDISKQLKIQASTAKSRYWYIKGVLRRKILTDF